MQLLRGGCVVCGRGSGPLCGGCAGALSPPPATAVRDVGRVPSAFAYEATGARVVQALKFRDGRRLVGPLADRLAWLVGSCPPNSVVSWIPTSAARRHQRGFDQAELLARAVARRVGRPCRPVLRRVPGPAQTGRDRAHRQANVHFAPIGAPSSPVVLVDDVCTTGATARAAVGCLRAVGAHDVRVVVVARTP